MDETLQGPLKELAQALHHAIEESADVERALAALRERGLAAMLLLEVTVALSTAGETGEQPDTASGDGEWDVELSASGSSQARSVGPTEVAPADAEFLRSLRIRLD